MPLQLCPLISCIIGTLLDINLCMLDQIRLRLLLLAKEVASESKSKQLSACICDFAIYDVYRPNPIRQAVNYLTAYIFDNIKAGILKFKDKLEK